MVLKLTYLKEFFVLDFGPYENDIVVIDYFGNLDPPVEVFDYDESCLVIAENIHF